MPKTLVPQQRMGNEDELAGTILYLASKVSCFSRRLNVDLNNLMYFTQAGGFCNGALIILDGGFLHNHSGS